MSADRTCQAFTHAFIGAECGRRASGQYLVRVETGDGVYEDEAWLCEECADELAEGPVSVRGDVGGE